MNGSEGSLWRKGPNRRELLFGAVAAAGSIALPHGEAAAKEQAPAAPESIALPPEIERLLPLIDTQLANPRVSREYHQCIAGEAAKKVESPDGTSLSRFEFVTSRFEQATDLPPLLRKLAPFIVMQESKYRTDVRSPAGALGPWQFMPKTGNLYGLDPAEEDALNTREDFVASTEAAIRYMRDRYDELRFDPEYELLQKRYKLDKASDFLSYIIINSYNTGPENVRAGLRLMAHDSLELSKADEDDIDAALDGDYAEVSKRKVPGYQKTVDALFAQDKEVGLMRFLHEYMPQHAEVEAQRAIREDVFISLIKSTNERVKSYEQLQSHRDPGATSSAAAEELDRRLDVLRTKKSGLRYSKPDLRQALYGKESAGYVPNIMSFYALHATTGRAVRIPAAPRPAPEAHPEDSRPLSYAEPTPHHAPEDADEDLITILERDHATQKKLDAAMDDIKSDPYKYQQYVADAARTRYEKTHDRRFLALARTYYQKAEQSIAAGAADRAEVRRAYIAKHLSVLAGLEN